MGNTSESAAINPWPWIIESLAGLKKVDNSTLHDLINVVPADLSKNTRELIAMRCLESLFGSTHGISSDSSSLDSRVGLDFSQSSEDVLQQILHDIPLSNLEIAGAKLGKWDVYPFMMHKRAITYKSELEQLKDSIIERTHPYTERLRERSGFAPQNWVPVNDGKCIDLTEKDIESCSYGEIMGAKENASSKEHLHDKNFSSSKRNGDYSANEQVGIDECDDFLRDAKKIKCCAPSSIMSKKDKRVYPHDTKDDNEHHIEPVPMNIDDPDKILCKSTMFQSEQEVGLQLKKPNATYPNGSKKLVTSDEVVVDAINACGAEHNGLIEFSISHMRDFSASTEWREQNLCTKCNEGDQLLVCRTTTCQLTVHESCLGCLGTSACFDANGNFFCPFCAYSHAASELLEAKKKASLAREDLRTFLGKAIEHQVIEHSEIHRNHHLTGIGREDKPEDLVIEQVNEISSPLFDRSQQLAEPPTFCDNSLPSCQDKGTVGNRLEKVLIGEEEMGGKMNPKSSAVRGLEENQVPVDKPEGLVIEHVNEINSPQFDRSHQRAEPPTLCDNILPSCQEEGIVCNRLKEALIGEEELGGITNPKSSAVGGLGENHVPVDQVAIDDRCFNQEVNVISVNQNNTEEDTRQEMQEQHNTNQTEEPASAHRNEEDNISKYDSENACNTIHSMRSQKSRIHKSPEITIPKLGRRKIAWTAEEEEILKEGVRKFGASGKNIPWKKILEFGSNVFLKERTPANLKDKWKNNSKQVLNKN